MVIITMHSSKTLWYLFFFPYETWKRLLVYCLSEAGDRSFFLFWQMVLSYAQNHFVMYMYYKIYTHLQSLLVFMFMLSKQDSKWLPQELVRKQIFVYSRFLVKSSADTFHSSVVEHSLFPACWTVLSQHSYYKMTKWPLVEWEVTECAWWRKSSYSRIQQIFLWF